MASAGIERSRWELAAESTVVKLRWFGIVMGYILVQTRTGLHDPWAVRAFLALGAGYAALDLAFWRMGEVILKGWPLFVSLMESVFIALLCYHDTGLDSPFRWYYLLSLICGSIRNRAGVAWWTLAFHCAEPARPGLGAGHVAPVGIEPAPDLDHHGLGHLGQLVAGGLAAGGRRGIRAAQRASWPGPAKTWSGGSTSGPTPCAASQARVIQQEKMAAFGLLAAGIAHEVGNPLAALSSLVQMLKRRGPDPYTAEKLDLAGRQLQRIERTIRELVDFSRPASTAVTRVRVAEVVDEALGIAKYYQRTKQRSITTDVPVDLPTVRRPCAITSPRSCSTSS